MDPVSDDIPAPVTVQMHGQAAHLLVKLMQEMKATDPNAVLTTALGILEQANASKSRGHRLGIYDPASGRFMDLAI